MKKTLLNVLAASITILISTAGCDQDREAALQAEADASALIVSSCDKVGAKAMMAEMQPYMVHSVTEADGWIIVTFGNDYFSWTDRQTEGMTTAYANFDACVTGQARKLEFKSPSGKLIARADGFRGIQMK